MTFLNGLLAFGAAAFAVPLLIHLLHRGRSTTVDWGAMHLLQATKSSNSRRIQWQQLLLLLIRCMIPILLALAMSRPLIPTWQSASGQSAVSLALILDDSTSMFANTDQGNDQEKTTRFAEACIASAKILRGLPGGSVGSVFLGGATPERLSSQNPFELAIQLERLALRAAPSGELNISSSLQEANKWLSESPHLRRQIILLSDMQSNEWKKEVRISGAEPSEWLAQQAVVPELALLNLSSPRQNKKTDNLFVESLKVNSSLTSVDKETQIVTVIGNHSDTDCDSVFIALLDNDFEIDRQAITIAANSKNTMLSRWSPKKAGDHVLRIQVVRNDDLMADNTLSVVSHVFEPIGVVLVDGDRKSEAMQSETDFLKLALSPFAVSQKDRRDTFASKVIGPDELNENVLESCRVLCLCNVPNLSTQQLATVRAFVEKGNGLLTFTGDRIEKDSYQGWATADLGGIRICTIGNREPTEAANASKADLVSGRPMVRLQVQGTDFSPIRELSKASQVALEKVEFKFRRQLELETKCMEPPFGATIAARFEDGQPWIIESNLGKGKCLWISTAIDDDDSNLPSKSVFVPWVQRIVAYAAQLLSAEGNVAVGATWTIQADVATKLSLTKPDGTFNSIETNQDGQVELPSMRLIGTYTARPVLAADTSAKNDASAIDQEVGTGLYAACVSQTGKSSSAENSPESRLGYLEQKEAEALAKRWNASLSTTIDQLFDSTQSKWFGREIWFWIWTALVIFFLAEIALEQWLSPRLRSGKSNTAFATRATPLVVGSSSSLGGKRAS